MAEPSPPISARTPLRGLGPVLGLALVLVACGGEDEAAHPLSACADRGASPSTIVESLAVFDELPEPTIPCFVASLERPLEVVASRSQLSAQPALDEASPRLFLLRDTMVLTVVLAGSGQHLLEYGEWETPTRTLKAELAFPVEPPIAPEEPFVQVLNDSPNISGIEPGCAPCHHDEQPSLALGSVTGYSSTAYRPVPSLLVPLDQVASQRRNCADDDRSERCDLLRAVVDFGATQGSFNPDLATFGE